MTTTTRSITMQRVVVTGLGAVTPIGLTTDDFWNGLISGTSGAGPITKFDTEEHKSKIACELKDFDPEPYMDPKQARRQDLFSQYALAATAQAFDDAKLDTSELEESQRDRIGAIFGTGVGGSNLFIDQVRTLDEYGPRRISPFFVPMMITNMAPGLIAMEHGLRGPNHAVVSACATGNDAISDALLLLRQGHADAMLVGGTEASINELCVGGFASMRALSTRNDDPESASRPFDEDRDGFVPAEGAGALVLETLEHALERGAPIYAEIAGVGKSNDAYHYAAPDPEGRGAVLAMRAALNDAGTEPEAVDHVNMHATSTPMGDTIESNAMKTVFGDHAYNLSLSATKSMTGHLLGAAGAVEAIAAVLAIKHGIVPPTINTENLDEGCDLDYTLGEAKERPVRMALNNAFGFGGHNTTLAFSEYTD
ncbi:beta-ketoacyl-[acyl-carrier-protein] synthase II [Longibacter salinarum]|uniref:3-oxoacyl-[acyl-carrier-protein] synthase 2 n=1 Tax=Longibacter salinarum TaxID=1850348 RepID=A0A2A8CVH4_9BACT|nr:beta-ketoacyl-ACP synthase II [Longibacter salinarum]PEN12597.1 beta-ketoacyl-[acyl-carrier-protein] synthase II [Longibacter salinarum]